MSTTYAILLDSRIDGCGEDSYCATFHGSLEDCLDHWNKPHDGATVSLAKIRHDELKRWPIVMRTTHGGESRGFIVKLRVHP